MGKKYIIELEDKPFRKEDGDFLHRVKGFNSLVFDMTGISKLTPYAEPDLEQVRKYAYKIGYEKGYRGGVNRIGDAEDKIRKEAYQKGYETGYEDGYNEPGKNQQEAYQRGLADAWDAARKIVTMPNREFINSDILDLDPGESIFTKYTASECIEKIRQYEQKQEMDGLRQNIQTIVDQCGYTLDEITAVLEKMRGEQDGRFNQQTGGD